MVELDRRHVWHPYTQMPDYARRDPVIVEEGQANVPSILLARRLAELTRCGCGASGAGWVAAWPAWRGGGRSGHPRGPHRGGGTGTTMPAAVVRSEDLAARWRLPLLVVARPGLGTLNHTVLTVAYAHQKELRVLGVVLNPWLDQPTVAEATNPAELVRLTCVPILGRILHLPGVAVEGARLEGPAEAVTQHLDLAPVLDLLTGSRPVLCRPVRSKPVLRTAT